MQTKPRSVHMTCEYALGVLIKSAFKTTLSENIEACNILFYYGECKHQYTMHPFELVAVNILLIYFSHCIMKIVLLVLVVIKPNLMKIISFHALINFSNDTI